jgi:hypothetical protein
MLDLRQTLPVLFSYDHASGMFRAQLPNGARFDFPKGAVSGKVENMLTLFQRQVIDLNSGKYVQARNKKGELVYTYDESQVKRYARNGLPEIDLDDLELEL